MRAYIFTNNISSCKVRSHLSDKLGCDCQILTPGCGFIYDTATNTLIQNDIINSYNNLRNEYPNLPPLNSSDLLLYKCHMIKSQNINNVMVISTDEELIMLPEKLMKRKKFNMENLNIEIL